MSTVSKAEMKWEQLANLSACLDSMRLQLVLTDVTLGCGKTDLLAHRLILSAGSPYFRAMFRSGMQETLTGKVDLQGITSSAMKVVLQFIYTGSVADIDDNVTLLKAVLAACHLLQVGMLYDYCRTLLCERLIEENFTDLWNIADHYDDASLSQTVLSHVAENFEHARHCTQFLEMSVVQLKRLLRTAPLRNTSADIVISSILMWIKADEVARCSEIADLFNLVNLKSLTTDCLAWLQTEALIRNSLDVVRLLLYATTTKLSNADSQARLMCFGKANNQGTVSVYNNLTRTWAPIKILPFTLLRSMATVYLDEHVYFIGGADQRVTEALTSAVLKYNYDDNSVIQVRSLKLAKCNVGAIEFHGKIYALGGTSGENVVYRDVDVYDPETDHWDSIASTNEPHNFPRVVQVLDHIFVIGSRNCVIVERYAPRLNQWTKVNAIPGAVTLDWPRVAVCDHRIYALQSSKKQLCIYDPVSNCWEAKILEGGPRATQGIWSYCRKDKHLPFLFITDERKTLYKFDTTTGEWEKLVESMDVPWHWWQSVVVT